MTLRILALVGLAASAVYAQDAQVETRIDRPRDAQLSPAPDTARQSNWIDESARPAGDVVAGQEQTRTFASSAPEVRQYVAQLANTALTPGSLSKAADMLCDEDRTRVADQLKQLDLAEHDLLVQRFREQWQTRYGEEFDLARQRSVVSDYYVLDGLRSPEEAIMAAHQPPGSSGNGNHANARPQEHPADQQRSATVVIPPNPNEKQPAMILMLMNEKAGQADWRLNTPNTLNAEKLRQNLDERISRFLDGQTKWPADSREAYRVVGYHVLATFNDQPADRPKQNQQTPQPAPPDNPSLDT